MFEEQVDLFDRLKVAHPFFVCIMDRYDTNDVDGLFLSLRRSFHYDKIARVDETGAHYVFVEKKDMNSLSDTDAHDYAARILQKPLDMTSDKNVDNFIERLLGYQISRIAEALETGTSYPRVLLQIEDEHVLKNGWFIRLMYEHRHANMDVMFRTSNLYKLHRGVRLYTTHFILFESPWAHLKWLPECGDLIEDHKFEEKVKEVWDDGHFILLEYGKDGKPAFYKCDNEYFL